MEKDHKKKEQIQQERIITEKIKILKKCGIYPPLCSLPSWLDPVRSEIRSKKEAKDDDEG